MFTSTPVPILTDALAMLCDALDLLDRADALGDIGAHVDLACERLRDVLSSELHAGNSCSGPLVVDQATNPAVSDGSSETDIRVGL